MRPGERIAVLSTGTIMPLAQELVSELTKRGLSPELVSFHTVKPLDEAYLNDAITRFDHVITLEEHNVSGGFGSAVREYFSDPTTWPRVHRFGIPDRFIDQVHSTADARAKAGLTVADIMSTLSERGVV